MKRENQSNEYEDDLYIDPFTLDEEALIQPTLMKKYTSLLAGAKREVDRVAERLSVCKAELDKKIRKDPEKYGLDKLTENIIMSTILVQKKYRKINNELIEAKYQKEMTGGSVASTEHKKSSVELLVKLLGMNYFAGPSVPRVLDEKFARDKRVNKKIKVKKNKKNV